MAVVSVTEFFESREGNAEFGGRRRFVRLYEVYTDSATDGPVVAGTVPGQLPVMGDPHPEESAAVVVNRDIRQDAADPLRWMVTITYDNQPVFPSALQPDGTQATVPTFPDNPLLRPTVWRVGFEQLQEVFRSAYLTDEFGANTGGSKPVTNSAGFLFDPPVMIESSRLLIQASRNVAGFQLDTLTELRDSINSEPWKGFPAYTVRCVGVEASSGFENGLHFVTLSYTFAVKDDGWFIRVLDAGTMERAVLGTDIDNPPALLTKLIAITDPAGNPVTEPVPLDGAGRKLQAGLPEVYLVFSAYKQRDFNALVVV